MFSFQGVRFSKNTLDTIRSEINKKTTVKSKYNEKLSKINFENFIEVDKINFSYDHQIPIIKNFSFNLQKGDFVGIKGKSGSEKHIN